MRYAAFLRGVNVGAHNRIRMADFKRALQEIGFSRVETYIQSGNAAFDSDREEAALAAQIKGKLAAMGVNADVVLRSADEMRAIVEGLPFSGAEIASAENDEWESLYVVLFPAGPDETKICPDADDRAVFHGREAYLLLGRSIRLSKLAAGVMKLDKAATARNWNTILKMREMTAE